MALTANNLAHWMAHPLEGREILVLERIKEGSQPFDRDQFEVAYLIARECVEADMDERTLTITSKGEEGLEVFRE